jgi:GNAT superfamily N-acetyltransferase
MANLNAAVRQADLTDLDMLVPLFDAYRQFYGRPGNLEGARRFLLERFERRESVIFLALQGDKAIGFTQLYPSFSSGAMARIFILNDLFVIPEGRRQGAGSALLQAASAYARRMGAIRLSLSTEISNTAAQSLYEMRGWKRDTVFCAYQLNF